MPDTGPQFSWSMLRLHLGQRTRTLEIWKILTKQIILLERELSISKSETRNTDEGNISGFIKSIIYKLF